MRSKPRIAITMGDPAGIGPEICCRALAEARVRSVCSPLLIGSRVLLERVSGPLGLTLPEEIEDPGIDEKAMRALLPGVVCAEGGRAAAACIERAVDACLQGRTSAMVTAPIHKEAIHAAGIAHTGHTEWIAERCSVSEPVMMLYDARIAVALATVHRSLASVPAALSVDAIVRAGTRLADALERLRGAPPRLALLGLNPHAGEGGLFGDEEARIVNPALERLRDEGLEVEGPLPPDTAFTPSAIARYDGHICLYHDQGLIPFKALAFSEGVNVTLGLPITRTSVDHGTAFPIAWRGEADHTSLVEAILLAARLAE
jgi:4-hydroxythreonine-4-phosphate dehydrogenase